MNKPIKTKEDVIDYLLYSTGIPVENIEVKGMESGMILVTIDLVEGEGAFATMFKLSDLESHPSQLDEFIMNITATASESCFDKLDKCLNTISNIMNNYHKGE